jgi:hypothetical protein
VGALRAREAGSSLRSEWKERKAKATATATATAMARAKAKSGAAGFV